MAHVKFLVFGLIALIVLVAVIGDAFHGVPWYEELKSWQDGIAAVIAFAALIAVALVGLGGVRNQIAANAREASQRHEREQTTEKLRIAAALAGEVDAVVTTMQRKRQVLENWLNEHDDPAERRRFFVSFLRVGQRRMPPTRIYEGLEDRIGILGHAIVEQAAGFHTALEGVRRTYWSGPVGEMIAEAEDTAETWIENYLVTTILLKTRGDWLLYELKSFIAETTGEEPPEPPASDDEISHRPNISKGAEEDETDSPARSA